MYSISIYYTFKTTKAHYQFQIPEVDEISDSTKELLLVARWTEQIIGVIKREAILTFFQRFEMLLKPIDTPHDDLVVAATELAKDIYPPFTQNLRRPLDNWSLVGRM